MIDGRFSPQRVRLQWLNFGFAPKLWLRGRMSPNRAKLLVRIWTVLADGEMETTGMNQGQAADPTEDGLEVVLAAYRDSSLVHFSREQLERVLGPTWHSGIEILGEPTAVFSGAMMVSSLLTWGVARLRPDMARFDAPIADRDWLHATSWRPSLALMCQYGFRQIPEFRDRYYRRPNEAIADTLCGLWNIGMSMYYRYLEKARRQLAQVFENVTENADALQQLREHLCHDAQSASDVTTAPARIAWHVAHARNAEAGTNVSAALWHLCKTSDVRSIASCVERHVNELAATREVDDQLARLRSSEPLSTREQLTLLFIDAAIARVRQLVDQEKRSYERAIRLAAQHDDALALANAYFYMGRFFELRETTRAIACYQDSITQCRRVIDASTTPDDAHDDAMRLSVKVLLRQAWIFVEQKHTSTLSLLKALEALRTNTALDESTQAQIEQVWAEYYRRADLPQLAVEHTYRALNLYERIDDREGGIKTALNLGLELMHMRDYPQACKHFARILETADQSPIDAVVLSTAMLDYGACLFFMGNLEEACARYLAALAVGERNGLVQCVTDAHYNLAEVYFTRYKKSGDQADLANGDLHLEHAIATQPHEGSADARAELARLKDAVLRGTKSYSEYKLLTGEDALHFEALSEVRLLRQQTLPTEQPATRVSAHLEIAAKYLSISVKEREAASALSERYGLQHLVTREFSNLKQTFNRSRTREDGIAERWRELADFMNAHQCSAVLEKLFHENSINKSTYATMCGVGLSTASKHLAKLVEFGLLEQHGKGPATHYSFPAADG